MQVTVLYFAAVRDLRGEEQESLELPDEGATVATLRARLEGDHRALRGRLGRVRMAVNEHFASEDQPLGDGDVVALIPPVAGGSGVPPVHARVGLTRDRLSIDAAAELVRHPAAGALAIFVGVVRDHHDGEPVSALEYSAYESMAVAEMARVVGEIEAEVPGVRLAVHHRIGPLAIGDDAVICVASAAHRGEAFTAGRALIDRIKDRVPIWKRETRPAGAHWVRWEVAGSPPAETPTAGDAAEGSEAADASDVADGEPSPG